MGIYDFLRFPDVSRALVRPAQYCRFFKRIAEKEAFPVISVYQSAPVFSCPVFSSVAFDRRAAAKQAKKAPVSMVFFPLIQALLLAFFLAANLSKHFQVFQPAKSI